LPRQPILFRTGLFARSRSISGSAGPIFTIFASYGRWSIRPSFSDILRDVAMATNLVAKMGQNCLPPALIALLFKNVMGQRRICARIKSATNVTTSCKILAKIGPVVSEEKILMKNALYFHVVVRRISSNISEHTGPNFAIFSPYESALCADDGSVLYFPICQGTLPWKPNNVAEMKANRYYVHSLHVRQMVARFRFATTWY